MQHANERRANRLAKQIEEQRKYNTARALQPVHWQVKPSDYPKQVHDLLYTKGLIDSTEFLFMRDPWRMQEWEASNAKDKINLCELAVNVWGLYKQFNIKQV